MTYREQFKNILSKSSDEEKARVAALLLITASINKSTLDDLDKEIDEDQNKKSKCLCSFELF